MDIALMYHYVRNPETFKGSVPVSKEKFRWQMEQLVKKYDIVSPDDLVNNSNTNRCVITFDDGTKDQYENAYSILKEMGLPGYFTVMSGPLVNKEIPIFHLVHILLSEFNDEETFKEIKTNFDLPDLSNAHNIYAYEHNISRRYIKYLLNFAWTPTQSEEYLKQKVTSKYNNLNQFINDFYILPNEFKKMSKDGMTIGVHAHKHIGFTGDGEQFFKDEIKPCMNFINENLNIVPQWYTPTFGGGENKNKMKENLEGVLKRNGVKGVFTTNEGVNKASNSYWLNRFDCTKFNKALNLF